ncbi:MAG: hypothetical protein VKL39_11140, partial [Leptolyngbyaceae bacterium]|nr:hypothetical protein [Leptolyngbyaceae bacterium]
KSIFKATSLRKPINDSPGKLSIPRGSRLVGFVDSHWLTILTFKRNFVDLFFQTVAFNSFQISLYAQYLKLRARQRAHGNQELDSIPSAQ